MIKVRLKLKKDPVEGVASGSGPSEPAALVKGVSEDAKPVAIKSEGIKKVVVDDAREVMRSVLPQQDGKSRKLQLQPLHKGSKRRLGKTKDQEAENEAEDEDEDARTMNYEVWEKVASWDERKLMDGIEKKQASETSNANSQKEDQLNMDSIKVLWQEAVAQHKAKQERETKLLEAKRKREEQHIEDMRSIRELAEQNAERRRREEERTREDEERKRNEAREQARKDREQMAQTIDMDAHQQIMMDGDDDDDDDDDLGGF